MNILVVVQHHAHYARASYNLSLFCFILRISLMFYYYVASVTCSDNILAHSSERKIS